MVTAAVAMTAALILAPTALADPLPVVPPPPAPAPAPDETVQVASANPATAPADPAVVTPPPPDGTVQAVAANPAAPPAEVPHLSSLENLPPGTTDTPLDNQGHGMSYLRDIWHAYQTQEVDGKGALLLLTQRPMNADAVPPPGMPANPTPPEAPLPPDAPLAPEAPLVP